MGITQVPPVPVPSAKGEIVVGTATGPTKLTASTSANLNILTDPTTASGLKFGITGLTAVHQLAPGHTNPTAITGYSYTSPNLTYNAAGHPFLVNHYVVTNGIIQNSTTGTPGRASTVVAVSGSSTFTFNISTTAPGSWVSGGLATFMVGGNPSIAKYINGTYFIGTNAGSYWYSTDAVNWTYGQVPNQANGIVGIDHDGTTYAIAIAGTTNGGGIWTSTTLTSNSWVQRSTFGGFYIGDIKWCAGSVNRWVAVGSSTSVYNGGGVRIETASSGAVTWTSQTINGTATNAAKAVAFDGSNTVVVNNENEGLIIGSSGATAWTGYASNVTTNPSSNIANQAYLRNGISPAASIYNPVTGRWLSYNLSTPGLGNVVSTTNALSLPWNKSVAQNFWSANYYAVQDNNSGHNTRNPIIYDSASQTFKTYSLEGGNFQVFSYSATPTTINTFQEVYPLTGIQTSVNMPSINYRTSNAMASPTTGTYTAVYGNGKWVVLSQMMDSGNFGNYVISVLS